MGIVCAAYDPRLRRNVAVKLLRPDRNGPDASARLRREARALATLSHPNVVSVFECGVLDDRDGNYVVMELVVGETLRRWCDRTRPTPSEIVTAYLAAARGLAAAHAAGLVHRDIKPDNVLIAADGRICVTDFGLARVVTAPTGQGSSDASSSQGGSASDDAGTPMYMAPEQRDGAQVGPAADQYAFCVSLWEALAGASPPGGEAGRVSSRLRVALLRGLSPDASARWPDTDALARVVAHTRGATTAHGIAAVAGIALTVGVGQWALDRRALADEHCTAPARRMDEAWGGESRDAVVALARPRRIRSSFAPPANRAVCGVIDSPGGRSAGFVPQPETPTWSTPKFVAIVLAVHFVMIFLLNGVLNEELHLGVPSAAIAAAPVFVTVLLLPRWTVFARRRARGSRSGAGVQSAHPCSTRSSTTSGPPRDRSASGGSRPVPG